MLKRFVAPKTEDGQALVVVLLMLVIAAVVAAAITFRTISDIRRTTEERASSKAAAQVDSFLDIVTDPDVWDRLEADFCSSGFPCTLEEADIENLLGGVTDLECDDNSAYIVIRQDLDVDSFRIPKDGVFEVNLVGSSNTEFNVDWTGGADHLIVKVYADDGSQYYAEYANALAVGGSTWGTIVSGPTAIPYSGDALLARIRAIGGDANLSLTGLDVPQVAAIKASCYVKDAYGSQVYREAVRKINIHPSVPACFDYVLFDGDSTVEK